MYYFQVFCVLWDKMWYDWRQYRHRCWKRALKKYNPEKFNPYNPNGDR